MSSNMLLIIGGIVLGTFVLLLLREFWCWYWKINKIRNLLEQILERLPQQIKAEISEKQAKERNDVRLRQTKGSEET